jgi:Dolichyl-phosphate-mannose-protein mannosyltransferase
MSHSADQSAPIAATSASTNDKAACLRTSRLAAWVEGLVIATLTATIVAVSIYKDLNQPFNCDELFTFYGCKASGLSELFGLLSSGGFDASPPLYDVAVWQMQRVISNDHLALRLPASLGFVVMCLCLYGMARRRCPAPYAALALLTLPITAAFQQATNARPYGLMLGFAGLALFCWQLTNGSRWRPLALCGLAASLSAGVATHYYAILVLAPLGMAEAVRTIESDRKRIDVAVWVAFAFALAPLPVLRPLVAGARNLAAGASWLPVRLSDLKQTYLADFAPLLLLLAIGSLLLPRLSLAPARPGSEPAPAFTSCSKSDIALILGLIALPIIGFAVGVTVTKAYVPRYVVAHVAGVALLLAFVSNSLFRGRAVFGIMLALIMLLTFLSMSARDALSGHDNWSWLKDVARYSSRAAREGHRLTILNGDDFIVCHHYLDPSALKNLTLVDLVNDRHAKIYEGLNRWLARKGLGAFDQRGADWLTQHSDPYYIYRDLDFVFRIQPRRRLAIKLLDKNLYVIEADGTETITAIW